MSPQAQQKGEEEESGVKFNKKDPYKGFQLNIRGLAGVNTTTAPTAIKDNESPSIVNFVPIGRDLWRKLVGPQLICQCSAYYNIIAFVNEVINGSLVMFVILSDGSAGTVSATGQFINVGAPGTFTFTASTLPPYWISNQGITNWQNKYLIIIDAVTGLWQFDGQSLISLSQGIGTSTLNAGGSGYASGDTFTVNVSSLPLVSFGIPATGTVLTIDAGGAVLTYQINTLGTEYVKNTGVTTVTVTGSGAGLKLNITSVTSPQVGTCIAVWAGRVFTGNGRVLSYTAPASYYDFTSANGGGFLTIANTNLKQTIIQLSPYMDNLYIIGDHAIIALTGTTISASPASWYQMEIFNRLGDLFPLSVVNFNNILYVPNEYGVWEVASTQSQKIDYMIDITQVQFLNARAEVAQINNLNFYLLPVQAYSPVTGTTHAILMAFCTDLNQFTFIDFGFDISGVYNTLSVSDHSIYAWSGGNIYKLFVNNNWPVTSFIQSKLFEFDYPYVVKVLRYLMLDIFQISGSPNFTIYGFGQNLNQPAVSVLGTQTSSPSLFSVVGYDLIYPTQSFGFTNQYGELILFGGVQSGGVVTNVYYLPIGGELVQYTISETSTSVYDIIGVIVKGNLGRMLR